MSLRRKMRRTLQKQAKLNLDNILTEEEYNLIISQIKNDYLNNLAEYIGTQTLAMASKIIYENYGRLKNKETRLQVFGELYKKMIEDWGNDAPLKKYQDYLSSMNEPVQWRWEGVEK
ncbi:hypothetical protein [uncultured Phascolarctobacterium sp.]|uniref:hypothetical protein n=1 Tax=uncultured Phascolarctobacterium sp. TaxID=512296 RepID=UPI00261765F6|nr:hypothetical protein [uncultured Phascolarctobacterium sp.]